ncbi:MAG: sugar phosphate isomerase/epimerase family protein [Armatimonadia bacterium]
MSQLLPLGLSSACLGDDFTLEALPAVAEAGFTHIEVFPAKVPWLQTLQDFELLGQRTRESGLVTWSLHAPFGHHISPAAADETRRGAAVDAMTGALTQAEALGAGVVIIHPGYYDPQADDRGEALERAASTYNEIAPEASRRGLRLALEYLPPKPADLGCSAAELLWFRERIAGDIGFCLDVNHANLPETLPEVVRRLGPSLLTTHLSDNDGHEEKHWLPGEGVIDWPALMGALGEAAYRGPLLLEAGNFAANDLEQKLAALAQAAHGLQAAQGTPDR